ncbi:MAG: hypothetical protein JST92_19285 [Deltaproteobacteria bacterium]|nr:hypothetical protein [Deltaproteobacteria bacterium]
MGSYHADADSKAYAGPLFCIDSEENKFPGSACAVFKRGKRMRLAGVGHWMMLDDPAAFAKALDAVLAEVAAR